MGKLTDTQRAYAKREREREKHLGVIDDLSNPILAGATDYEIAMGRGVPEKLVAYYRRNRLRALMHEQVEFKCDLLAYELGFDGTHGELLELLLDVIVDELSYMSSVARFRTEGRNLDKLKRMALSAWHVRSYGRDRYTLEELAESEMQEVDDAA